MSIATIIPVDSIKMPVRFQRLCSDFAGGLDCMLRAVSSTGGLTTGTHRPGGCDTDEKWYLHIWRELSSDVYCKVREARLYKGSDLAVYASRNDLTEFEVWVDCQIGRLEESYGLADWDACDD